MLAMKTKISLLYSLFLAVMMAVFAFFVWRGDWLESDLKALLPQEQKWSAAQIQADEIQERTLNRQLIFLVGASDASTSFQLTEQLAEKLSASGLFSQIFAKQSPNLTALQAEIQQLKWAVLPEKVRLTLTDSPQHYFQQWAENIANPFGERGLLSPEQDWLGFGRFALESSQSLSKMQWSAETGFLFTQAEGKTWTLLRAELQNGGLFNAQSDLLELISQAKQQAHANQTELLAAGSMIFSAMAKQSAEKESTLMSLLGISLTLALLLAVFRSAKALWLFLPIGLGLVAGIVATVLCFGKIHILTLVVGSSLIGVLIDFPLHWLSGAKFAQNWNGSTAMNALKPTFLISLLVTLLGYGLLAFTALPILKQTALFSAVALVVALGATLCYLPYFIQCSFNKQTENIPRNFPSLRFSKPMLGIAVVVLLIGIFRAEWRDDIRQWVALPQAELNEAAKISELVGVDLGAQYFLITAENDEQLLERNRQLSQKLTELSVPHQALSQWILAEKEQKQFALQIIEKIRPLDYAVLQEIGVPLEKITQALIDLKNQPTISLNTALQTTLGEAWRSFYLGKLADGKVGSVIKVQSAQQNVRLSDLVDQQNLFWQDKRTHLNQAFEASRNQAAWLKAISFGLALLILWRWFGGARAVKMLAIPVVAILMTVGVFGWLGLPITLFAMFGLLLVSAIGIDYTAYTATAKEPAHTKYFAVSLAAFTTMISFGLLAFSGTPAVASFGVSVAVGVLFSLLLTLYFSRNLEKQDENSI